MRKELVFFNRRREEWRREGRRRNEGTRNRVDGRCEKEIGQGRIKGRSRYDSVSAKAASISCCGPHHSSRVNARRLRNYWHRSIPVRSVLTTSLLVRHCQKYMVGCLFERRTTAVGQRAAGTSLSVHKRGMAPSPFLLRILAARMNSPLIVKRLQLIKNIKEQAVRSHNNHSVKTGPTQRKHIKIRTHTSSGPLVVQHYDQVLR